MNCPSPGWYAAWASLLGILLAPAIAAEETPARTAARVAPSIDVILDDGMCLEGQVVSELGEPLDGTKLTLMRDGAVVSQFAANESGRFRVRLPRAGVYQLAVDEQLTTLRAWTPKAAPPSCAKSLLIVRGNILRGQNGQIPFTQVNPWLVAGVIAAAVAIPIVISNHRSDRGDGS